MRNFAIFTIIALVALSTALASSASTDDKSTEPSAATAGGPKAAKDITADEKARILQKVKADLAGDFQAEDEQRLAKAFDAHVGKPDQKFDENGWIEILESEVISDELAPTAGGDTDDTPSAPSDKAEPKADKASDTAQTKASNSDDNPAAENKENPQPSDNAGAGSNTDGGKDAKPQNGEKSRESATDK